MGLEYTDEQLAVIHSSGDARVDAVAGSGKTSTLIGYALAHPHDRILFLSFNRSTAEDARRKFRSFGVRNVRVETVHSLAFKEMEVGRGRFQLAKNGSLSLQDIVDYCRLRPMRGSAVDHLVLAKHVQQFLSAFCNSGERDLNQFDYLATVDEASKDSVMDLEELIYDHAGSLFDRMSEGQVPVTHDAYLKLYHLFDPFLAYDSILLDEAQDSSPVTLSILTAQEQCIKIVAGDSNQQIYGFRAAINSLESLPFPRFVLPHSFRFSPEIAKVAVEALSLKRHLVDFTPPKIVGLGPGKDDGSVGVISRTNLGLMERAIEVMEDEPDCSMYFEGNLSSYTFMSEGASLYDLLSLSMSQRSKIRSRFVRQFLSLESLEEYVAASGDQEMGLGLKMVKKYGNELFRLIEGLKGRQAPGKVSADLIFATLHKSKGAEYSKVYLTGGTFVSESSIVDSLSKARKRGRTMNVQPMLEEINALYVAVTRTKCCLNHDFWIGEVPPTSWKKEGYDG